LDIEIRWRRPIRLRDGWREDLIYTCDEIEDLPVGPGVYVFGRSYGGSITPLYVGRASSLSTRIWQQLNNASLMLRIQKATNGRRVLLIGKLQLKQGQQGSRVLDVVEPTLIEYSLAQGYELLNKQGTKIRVHHINSRGSLDARSVAPFYMQRRKGG
jgi:hypothetical protein